MLRCLLVFVVSFWASTAFAQNSQAVPPDALNANDLAVPSGASEVVRNVAARCEALRQEALAAHQRAHEAELAASMCRENCSGTINTTEAQRSRRIASQQFTGCVRTLQRVMAEEAEGTLRLAGYEDVTWGTPMDEVRASRTDDPAIEQDGVLCYGSPAFSLPAYACFYFGETGLREGRHIFLARHSDPRGYVADFNTVADTLAATYGPPISDEEAWEAEPSSFDALGDAIAEGIAIRTARWVRPGGTMTMQLRGGDGKVTHVLEFVPEAE